MIPISRSTRALPWRTKVVQRARVWSEVAEDKGESHSGDVGVPLYQAGHVPFRRDCAVKQLEETEPGNL